MITHFPTTLGAPLLGNDHLLEIRNMPFRKLPNHRSFIRQPLVQAPLPFSPSIRKAQLSRNNTRTIQTNPHEIHKVGLR